MAAGDVFVAGGSEAHDYLEMKDLRLINILFSPESLLIGPLDLPALPGYRVLCRLERAIPSGPPAHPSRAGRWAQLRRNTQPRTRYAKSWLRIHVVRALHTARLLLVASEKPIEKGT